MSQILSCLSLECFGKSFHKQLQKTFLCLWVYRFIFTQGRRPEKKFLSGSEWQSQLLTAEFFRTQKNSLEYFVFFQPGQTIIISGSTGKVPWCPHRGCRRYDLLKIKSHCKKQLQETETQTIPLRSNNTQQSPSSKWRGPTFISSQPYFGAPQPEGSRACTYKNIHVPSRQNAQQVLSTQQETNKKAVTVSGKGSIANRYPEANF